MLVRQDAVVPVAHQRAGVEVELAAVRRPGGPAQSDGDRGQVGRLLDQADVAALLQTDSHNSSNGWCLGGTVGAVPPPHGGWAGSQFRLEPRQKVGDVKANPSST